MVVTGGISVTVTVAGQMSRLPFRIASRPPETTNGTTGA
jgi:hypothetical protein